MNYDGLERSYWDSQIERIERLRGKIGARAASPPGRVIPDDTDLAIGTGRRLNLTVMFIDISAFSQRRSITADEQELMLRVLNLLFTEMIRIVEEYAGAVEKNTGDGLMAYFEDQPSDESGGSSVKRAIACALTMTAANEYLISPILRATGVPPLEFRTTLDHGAVTIARIGAAQRFNANVAIGNTANFAAKMLGLVKPGDIALGATAWNRLPPLWRTLWTELSPISTGWVYTDTVVPYPLYLYTGRWARLI
jgi:class 3 adenylate cyclase